MRKEDRNNRTQSFFHEKLVVNLRRKRIFAVVHIHPHEVKHTATSYAPTQAIIMIKRESRGRFLLPGAPKTPPVRLNSLDFELVLVLHLAATATGALLSFATTQWPDIGGTMPSEDFVFTTCVDPGSPP